MGKKGVVSAGAPELPAPFQAIAEQFSSLSLEQQVCHTLVYNLDLDLPHPGSTDAAIAA
jgi:hypothetical protein